MPKQTKTQKIASRGTKPAKQIASEMLPTRYSRASITKGEPFRRSMNDYAKMSPADASGEGQIGLTIFTMGRM